MREKNYSILIDEEIWENNSSVVKNKRTGSVILS
jgi:hypothetical protein